MAEHRFVYTVSGVDLSVTQRVKISQAIGLAVAQALASDAQGVARSDLLLNFPCLLGGLILRTEEAENIGIEGLQTLYDAASGATRAP